MPVSLCAAFQQVGASGERNCTGVSLVAVLENVFVGMDRGKYTGCKLLPAQVFVCLSQVEETTDRTLRGEIIKYVSSGVVSFGYNIDCSRLQKVLAQKGVGTILSEIFTCRPRKVASETVSCSVKI